MTVDEFTRTMSALVEVIKTKPQEEAKKIIIELFETSSLDIQKVSKILSSSKEGIEALQQDVQLVLQFALDSKASMKSQLQDIKKSHKARALYNNHSSF